MKLKKQITEVSHRQIPKLQTLHMNPLKMCLKIKHINPTN
jgi:hypothetical protein